MVGNKNTSTITFSYNCEKLFTDVCLLSSFMVKNTGLPLDEFIITDDEKEVYDVCLKQAMPNIYESLIKMSSGINNAFRDDVVVNNNDVLGRDAGTYIEFNIRDNGAYNRNILSLVESTLYDCLKYGILSEFYSICINADLNSISNSKFAASMNLLNQRLFQLKRKTVGSNL